MYTKANRIIKYNHTKGERRHIALVREAKKQGYSNPGSKPIKILKNIIPTANPFSRNILKKFNELM